MGTCYFYGRYPDCQNVNSKYCSLCKKFLCDTCRNDYQRRIGGMGSELEKWFRGMFSTTF